MKVFPSVETVPLKDDIKTEEDQKKLYRFSQQFESLKYKDVWLRALSKVRCVLLLKAILKRKKFLRKRFSLLTNDASFFGLTNQIMSITDDELPWYIIHPDSKLKAFWNVYMGVLLIYTAIIMPYTIAFIDSESLNHWFFINITIDLSFLIDMLLNFFSSYYEKRMTLVKSHSQIIKKYASTWLVFDLASCIPFELINYFNPSSETNEIHFFLKFLRFPKLSRIFKILKLFKSSSTYSRNLVLEKVQECFNLQQSSIRLVTSCLYIIVSLHIMACFWYIAAKIEGLGPETWVGKAGLMSADDPSIYISCIYWAATTFTTVGYGDISGVYFFSYVIGSLSSMFETVNMKDNILWNKLHLLDEFAKNSEISQELLKKLKKALKYSHKQNFLDVSEKEKILKELPLQLRFEIAMAMFGKAVNRVKFFNDKDKFIISEIVPYLQPLLIDDDQFAYEKGEHPEGIYFLLTGYAGFHFNNGTVFIKGISIGECFGDFEACMKITRKYSVKAIRACDLLLMKNDVIQRLHDHYYDVWVKIRNEATCKNLEIIRLVTLIKNKYFSPDKQTKRKFRVSIEGIIQKKTKKFEEESKASTSSNLSLDSIVNLVNNLNSRLYALQKSISKHRNSKKARRSTRHSQRTPLISTSSQLELPSLDF